MLIDAITRIMSYIILGLGNPGEEYESTRHNVGFMALNMFAKKYGATEWKKDGVRNAFTSKALCEDEKVQLIKPLTFMNKSGFSVKDLAGSAKKIEKMVVIHDDLDLPIGSMKIVFDRGSGGHRGVESIVKSVKSNAFIRVRIGVCPVTPGGKLKKPDHEKIVDFIVGEFKPAESLELKKVLKRVVEALTVIVTSGREVAMAEYN